MVYRSLLTVAVALGSLLVLLTVPLNAYVAFGLTGSVAGFIWTAWSRRSAVIAVIGAVCYGVIYRLWGGALDHYPGWWLAYPGALLGLGAIVVTMVRWIWGLGQPAQLRRSVVMLTAIPVLCAFSTVTLDAATKLTPSTYDYTLYAFDHSLGGPAFAVGRFMAANRVAYLICVFIYNALPLWAALTWMLWSTGRARRVWHADACFLALGAIGFLLYQICPASGPAYRFAGMFPWTEPDPAGITMGAAALGPWARNAMPSLHIAWAMLFAFVSFELKWPFRVASLTIMLATLAAVLGSGEHYLVDAMVAVPLLMSLIAALMPRVPRALRIGFCAGGGILTVAWLVAFRSGEALALSDAARIGAAALTVAAGILGMAALHRRSFPGVVREGMHRSRISRRRRVRRREGVVCR